MNKAILKSILVLSVLIAGVLACSFPQRADQHANPPLETAVQLETQNPPVAAETVQPSPAPQQPNAYYEGFSFVYDPALAQNVNAQTLQASAPVSNDMPPFEVNPTTYRFTFQGYTLPSHFLEARIDIFPIDEYRNLDPDNVTKEVDSLKTLLVNRPSVSSGNMPFLPIWNVAQVFHAQIKYIHFANGDGVRFISQGAQSLNPVNNQDLFYTFQGLTSDGVYYISAVLPLNHAMLPADMDSALSGQDYQAFAAKYPEYLNDIQNKLNEQDAASFN
ncbi:MAG: hypothetical protein LWX83_16790, partial [Anaerolineae bacterium]|nr:hypothetical protein [Anaerolineae bacterium]